MTRPATETAVTLTELPADLLAFLACETPGAWVEAAAGNLELMLIDHANCEKKAAATAMNLMYRYTEYADLLQKMSQLAREELLHFQQVAEIIRRRNIRYIKLSPSRYAAGLRELIGNDEQAALIDTLIVGALIEARSCERFARLVDRLRATDSDPELQRFYRSLLKSEARHYQDYLALARSYSEADLQPRIDRLRQREAELIAAPDRQLRFHSGLPVAA